jgi:hypothetical protein
VRPCAGTAGQRDDADKECAAYAEASVNDPLTCTAARWCTRVHSKWTEMKTAHSPHLTHLNALHHTRRPATMHHHHHCIKAVSSPSPRSPPIRYLERYYKKPLVPVSSEGISQNLIDVALYISRSPELTPLSLISLMGT